MGSWGVKARESDHGLDSLAYIETMVLRPIDFKHFDVRAILDFLESHIKAKLIKDHKGEMEYVDANYPDYHYAAVLLVAECLSDFYREGKLVIKDYSDYDIKGGKHIVHKRTITEFIFTNEDLDELLKELHDMLDPEHRMSKCWIGDDNLMKWQVHMQMLCESLVGLKNRKAVLKSHKDPKTSKSPKNHKTHECHNRGGSGHG